MVGDVAENALLEVGASIPRVDDFVRKRIAVYGVDGEVAPCGRVADGQRRVVLHLERAMPEAKLRLAARNRHVDVEMRELYDAEARADEIEVEFLCERGLEVGRRDSKTLDVKVLWVSAENGVANAAADEKRAATRRLHDLRDFAHRLHTRCRIHIY